MAKKFLYCLLLLLLLPLFVTAAYAHVGSDTESDKIEATIVEPDLFASNTPITVWLLINDKETGESIEGLNVAYRIDDETQNLVADDIAATKASEGKTYYIFEYTFVSGGNHEIHYEFIYQDEEFEFDFPIFVSEAVKESLWDTTTMGGAALFGIAALAVILWGVGKKKFKGMIVWLVILIALAGVAYSFYSVNKKGGTGAVVTCTDDGKCFFTAHWHVYVVPNVCGEERTFETEKGPLNVSHTHEERNIFHWHDKLEYDQVKKEPIDKGPLTLGAAFDSIEIPFNSDKFFDKINGDVCPGDDKPGRVKMLVNGRPNEEYREYVWNDADVVIIVFDSRTAEEVEEEYKGNLPTFPALGRG